MATVHRHGGDAPAQVAALARALKAAPRRAETHYQIGRLFLEVGPLERAIATLELAASLDPRDEEIRAYVASSRVTAGDFVGAEAALEGPIHGAAQYLYPLVRSRKRLWERSTTPSPAVAEGRARVYSELVGAALRGSQPSAAAEVDFLRAKTRPGFTEQLVAELRFAIGDVEAGVGYATRSVDAGMMDLVWFECCPLLDVARAHPAWAGLEARVAERAQLVRDALAREGLSTAD
jgi:tetratricopeptide (TPR) repeat protein